MSLHHYRFEFAALASTCEVQLWASDQAAAQVLADAAIAEVRRIEAKYSRYRPDSVVSAINRAAGREPVAVDAETAGLLAYADTAFRQSDGRFDITSGVLRKAWDFRAARMPADGELDRLLPLVGWDNVQWEAGASGGSIGLPVAGAEIDFGGFGKEYAADRAAAVLLAAGARVCLVNLGGDVRAVGRRPDGRPWQVGVQHPRQMQTCLASIAIENGAVATSGDYERFFELDGRRYCHLLDVKTGWPVDHWQSITVEAPLALVAGTHTTIAMLSGADALDYLRRAGVSYLAVDHDGRIFRGGNAGQR